MSNESPAQEFQVDKNRGDPFITVIDENGDLRGVRISEIVSWHHNDDHRTYPYARCFVLVTKNTTLKFQDSEKKDGRWTNATANKILALLSLCHPNLTIDLRP